MASLLLRHRTSCARGGGRFTAAKPEGCTCKPGFYGVLDMGERITLKATNLRDAERELVQKMEQRSAGDDPARKIGFDAWTDIFLDDFTGRGSSRREYETTIDYAEPVMRIARKDLRRITAEHVSAVLKAIKTANEGKVSGATLAKHLRNLSAIFEA